MNYKPFKTITKDESQLFGSKAVHLALMTRSGMPVPKGFALSTAWTSKIADQQFQFEDDDISFLKEIYDKVPGELISVRSSGQLEDMSDSSFAGQYDTVLDIKDFDHLKAAIIQCIKSSFNEEAVSYAKNKLNQETRTIALIIQEMAQGQGSGVLFGANPITNNYNEMVITATLGYGFGIVDGTSGYDEYVLDKKSHSLKTLTNNLDETIISEQLKRNRILTDSQLNELADNAQKAENLFGSPQDMEWVLLDESIKILQSRAITTLYPIEPEHLNKEKLRLYVCYNTVVQGMTTPYTPLGYEFCRCTFAGYTSIYYSGKKKILHPTFIPYINGRIHYDLTEVLGRRFMGKNFLGSFDDKDPQGGKLLKELYTIHRKTFLKQGGKFKLSLGIVKWGLSLTKYGKISRKDYNRGLKEAIKFGEDFISGVETRIDKTSSIDDKLKLIEDVMEELLTNSFQQVMYVAYGLKAFGKWQKWFEKNYPDMDLTPLSQALPNNPTTQMGLALMNLAVNRKDPSAPISIDDADVKEFLKTYGHRSDSDTDLGAKRWSEDPTSIINLIGHYMKDGQGQKSLNVHHKQQQEAEKCLTDLVELVKDKHSASKAKQLEFDLMNYRTLIGLRELPKFNMVRILAMFRKMLLSEAERFVASGHMTETDDISYLFFEDILKLKSMSVDQAQNLIAERRETFLKQSQYTKVPRIILSNGETYYQEMGSDNATSGDMLKGVPLSSGKVTGKVRILHTPDITGIESSEILVTHNTDPSWTPMFPGISGLIMESGGPISHGAIVAREYGLPSIGGVPRATEILKDGDLVELDGRTGNIILLES